MLWLEASLAESPRGVSWERTRDCSQQPALVKGILHGDAGKSRVKSRKGDAWVAQSGKRLPSAQVMIPGPGIKPQGGLLAQ